MGHKNNNRVVIVNHNKKSLKDILQQQQNRLRNPKALGTVYFEHSYTAFSAKRKRATTFYIVSFKLYFFFTLNWQYNITITEN